MENNMETFIDVVGSSEYAEYPDKIILDIDISVRAAKKDTAEKDITEVVNKTIDHLYECGLSKDEVFFGGRESYTPWWRRDKAGVETRNRITIQSSNKALVYQALETAERYKADKRIGFDIEERQPIYIAKDEDIQLAMQQAISDALSKATCLAEAAGSRVGQVLQIEEIKKGVRASGSYGDYDYGDYGSFAVGMAAGGSAEGYDDEPAARLERSSRTIFVKYRVKYALLNG